MATQRLLTIGELARRLHATSYQIEYLIETRRIEPIGRAGLARVFDEAALERLSQELQGREGQPCR